MTTNRSTPLAIEGGRIVDTANRDVIEDAGLVVDGSKLTAVGPLEELSIPDDAEVIDAEGRTVLPGFVDAHVHLVYSEMVLGDQMQFTSGKNTVEFNTIEAIENARTTLARGVTSVRDVASRHGIAVALRNAVSEGLIEGPRIRAGGPIVTTTAGLADKHPLWIDADTGWDMRIDGVDEAIVAARRQVKMDVDTIKLEASGEWTGYSRSTEPTMREAEIAAIVEEAHAHGRTVAAHAKATEGIKRAARAGVDTIEHGNFIDDEGLALMRDRGIPLVSTLTGLLDMAENAVAAGFPEDDVETINDEVESLKDAIERAHESGVTVAVGTDSGPPNSSHGNVNEEIVNLVHHCGFTPMEALVAATRTTAEVLGLGDQVGTLSPGMKADVVVVDGNPLEDVEVLDSWESISTVVKDGTVVPTSGTS